MICLLLNSCVCYMQQVLGKVAHPLKGDEHEFDLGFPLSLFSGQIIQLSVVAPVVVVVLVVPLGIVVGMVAEVVVVVGVVGFG